MVKTRMLPFPTPLVSQEEVRGQLGRATTSCWDLAQRCDQWRALMSVPSCTFTLLMPSMSNHPTANAGNTLVLRPLDGLDVNALLHHLPQWAHLAQLVDVVHGELDGTVHFLDSGEAAHAVPAARRHHMMKN
eukprot:1157328-Pelagomonas_calceolata.AAC.17